MATSDKTSKRSRLGNRVQRGIYKAAHGYMHPWYPALCARAWNLNYKGGGDAKTEVKLDVAAQARIVADLKARDLSAVAAWSSNVSAPKE